jgi:DNA-directed RNA polymerase sigma subunit (sigma70/sigma32)
MGPSEFMSHHGKNFISIDSGKDFSTLAETEASLKVYDDLNAIDKNPEIEISKDEMLKLFKGSVRALLALPHLDMQVVCLMFTNDELTPRTLNDIGKEYGLTRQAIHYRFENAFRKWPVLKNLFAMKIRKEKEQHG